ncbi:MAG: hypothetical protein JSS53_03950 [Proteobacteria bacterium]|nr:hypothetical protein [Pseudomonadota bacterium]
MFEIDRMIAIIKPTESFLEWINETASKEDNEEDHLTLEEIRQDCTAILIPSFDDIMEAQHFIEEIYLDIFTFELNSWYTDKTMWPEKPSYDLFKHWFEIEFHSYVLDYISEMADTRVLQ